MSAQDRRRVASACARAAPHRRCGQLDPRRRADGSARPSRRPAPSWTWPPSGVPRRSGCSGQLPGEPTARQERLATAAGLLEEAGDRAGRAGVRVGVETHDAFLASATVAELLALVPSPGSARSGTATTRAGPRVPFRSMRTSARGCVLPRSRTQYAPAPNNETGGWCRWARAMSPSGRCSGCCYAAVTTDGYPSSGRSGGIRKSTSPRRPCPSTCGCCSPGRRSWRAPARKASMRHEATERYEESEGDEHIVTARRQYGWGIAGSGVIAQAHANAIADLPKRPSRRSPTSCPGKTLAARLDIAVVSECVPSGLRAHIGIRADSPSSPSIASTSGRGPLARYVRAGFPMEGDALTISLQGNVKTRSRPWKLSAILSTEVFSVTMNPTGRQQQAIWEDTRT